MAIDSTREVRRAGLLILKASSLVTGLVPTARIFSQSAPITPDWPFILWGSPSGTPLTATCLDGQEITVAIHAFAQDRKQGSAVVETAEDFASRIGAAIAKSLDRRKADIVGGRMTIAWRGSQLLRDPEEASAFHSVQNFRIRCMTN